MKLIHNRRDLALNGAPPLFDQPLHVGRPNIGDKEHFLRLASDVLARAWLTNNGPLVVELEERIAKLLGVKNCIAMCNGTVALEIAVRALNLHGEVIIPSYTFIATAHALSWQGITPVFADINPETHCIDAAAVERMITPRTSGILGVHLWGRPCDIESITRLANDKKLLVLYDAAHAFGVSHQGTMIGNFGECEVFSFHATKFFNTFEGGAVTTNNDDLAEKIRLMRNFGFKGEDNVIHNGTNGKLQEISAAMGLVNLEGIPTTINHNKSNYECYLAAFTDIPVVRMLRYDKHEKNNYQYIVVEISDDAPATRDEIVAALRAENVLARKYFWPGCHKMKPYRELYPHSNLLLAGTEAVSERVVVLPTGNSINSDHINSIASVIRTMVQT